MTINAYGSQYTDSEYEIYNYATTNENFKNNCILKSGDREHCERIANTISDTWDSLVGSKSKASVVTTTSGVYTNNYYSTGKLPDLTSDSQGTLNKLSGLLPI